MSDGESVGAAVRRYRIAAGLTQAELARRVGVHVLTIIRYEQEVTAVPERRLERIAAALGVDLGELAAGHDAASQAPSEGGEARAGEVARTTGARRRPADGGSSWASPAAQRRRTLMARPRLRTWLYRFLADQSDGGSDETELRDVRRVFLSAGVAHLYPPPGHRDYSDDNVLAVWESLATVFRARRSARVNGG